MKKIGIISGLVLVVCLIGGLGWGVNYLFNYAIVRGEKDFINASEATGSSAGTFSEWNFSATSPTLITQATPDGLTLKAAHFKQEQIGVPKLAIIAHGYTSDGEHMKDFGELYYQLGFDLLVPDARGHGQSEGEYLGFGWPDRLDYVQWINQMLAAYDQKVEIILFGVSMGGATVMMTAGEKLPEQVKLVIEDCGYDSVEGELSYQLKEMFNLPAFPLLPLTSVYSGYKAGYTFTEASAVAQLQKNKLPMLFIHGEEDDFVPTEMVHQVYAATKGPKELYLVPKAKHAEAFSKNKEKYQAVVKQFLANYLTD